jgi:hypothetical protein
MGLAFLWITTALQKSGRLDECVTEGQKALEILGGIHTPQVDCEIEVYRIVIESLAQMQRWDAIWQYVDVALAPPQNSARSAVWFAVLGAVIANARDDNDRRMAMQRFEEAGGWNEILLQRPDNSSIARMVGLYLATAARLQDWARIDPLITSARWEWIDRCDAWFYIGEEIARLCRDYGRAIAFSAFSDLFTNGLASVLKSVPNYPSSASTDARPPGIAFLEGCLLSFIWKINDAGFLTDVVDTIQDRFPDRFKGHRIILTAVAEFHRAGRDRATLARLDPDIAQILREIWLPDAEPDQHPLPRRRAATQKSATGSRRKA